MTSEQKQVKDWMLAFGQECPEKPTVPSLEKRKLRAMLQIEECLELVAGLGFKAPGDAAKNFFHVCSFAEPDLTSIADGCTDLKVVTDGTMVACGLVATTEEVHVSDDINDWVEHRPIKSDPIFNEVMRSNWTKLWTREELEHDWPEMRGMKDITGDWFQPALASRHVTQVLLPGETQHKFIGGAYLVKDSSGKVIKSPSYSPANLQPLIA